jgi:hypothetical protein
MAAAPGAAATVDRLDSNAPEAVFLSDFSAFGGRFYQQVTRALGPRARSLLPARAATDCLGSPGAPLRASGQRTFAPHRWSTSPFKLCYTNTLALIC